MFSFFSKKEYLVDYLEGFIDIHNHILPGIDDGAKTAEESIDLIKGFGEFGVKDFICTPHIMHNYYENTPKTIKKSYKKLKKVLKEEKYDVKLTYAAEHMIDDNFEHILVKDKILPLNSNHLLIEMSYLQPSINFDVSIQKIQSKQFFPVFAHPERYQYLNCDYEKYEYYKSKGLKFQMNLLSLSNYYGKEINKTALKLLNDGLYDFIGSDVHNSRHLSSIRKIKISKQTASQLLTIIDNNKLFL
ncbi:CpsB/CapC family capsule biosynthesis tyrosine phosphatase [Croceitalea sp. P059]|uniref:tyrosine-protein phosphatase n=1 Tax=Croceitalea sp. P059 TaxID=3075601 RepID=UPI002883EA78|nr:CpsB/CapC family capsule biosynthesis tyrosine phosphatase [Croceitalea sp. P059]MDT0539471.1 CpsB/CapC family capsule biosynthesis tyrosine phosphatase [Croceitalea sp. P059]